MILTDITYSVVWFSLGAHHVPHSGDIPNTLMHTSASSVMFVPHNFHDRDPSRMTSQGVFIEKDEAKDGEAKVRYYGGRQHEGVTLNVVSYDHVLQFV
jgi:primary-amine oxidase